MIKSNGFCTSQSMFPSSAFGFDSTNLINCHFASTSEIQNKSYALLVTSSTSFVVIKQLLSTLKIKADLTFAGLFKESISKKVLVHYLDELENKRPALLDFNAPNDNALLAALIVNNPEMGAKQILQMFGFKKALESATYHELRTMFSKHNTRSWYRLIADAQKIKLLDTPSPFADIRKTIIKFKPLKLAQIQRFLCS